MRGKLETEVSVILRLPLDQGVMNSGTLVDVTGMGDKRAGRVTPSPSDRQVLAGSLAAEMRDMAASEWPVRSRGAANSYVVFIEEEIELADLVVVLWDISRSGPFPEEVSVHGGVAGSVVLVNGPDFSVVARSGGPVLVLSDRIRGVLRVDRDPSWQTELSALISELIAVGQGAQPFDESTLPPPPPLPWHRDR